MASGIDCESITKGGKLLIAVNLLLYWYTHAWICIQVRALVQSLVDRTVFRHPSFAFFDIPYNGPWWWSRQINSDSKNTIYDII